MKLVVFGLSVSSSWGNGHAVLWRALDPGARGARAIAPCFSSATCRGTPNTAT